MSASTTTPAGTYLLDTDVVIDHLNGFTPTSELLQQLLDAGGLLATNAIVVAEVFSGLTPAQRPVAAAFLDQLLYLPLTRAIASHAGELRFAARQAGATLAVADTLIAATALATGGTLVTGNARYYPHAGLAVIPLPGRPARRQ